MSFTLDWATVDIDGSNTLKSGSDTIGVTISTPQNSEHREWLVSAPDDKDKGDEETLRSECVSEPTRLALAFDEEVTDLSFTIFDVDAGKKWDDKVTVIARNAAGEDVPVTFSGTTAGHDVDCDSVEGKAGTEGGDVSVHIAGPVQSLTIIHDNGDEAHVSGAVELSDVHFHAAPEPAPERDGIVSGTDGDDLIVADAYTDVDGDEIDAEDAIIPGDAPNDDRVVAGAGDDTVDGGHARDTIEGGIGRDSLSGGVGDDILYGGSATDGPGAGVIDDAAFPSPAPDHDPHDDRDTLSGGEGDDALYGQDDDDRLSGGSGDDTLDGGIDDDTLVGGSGSDSVLGGQGDDVIDAGVANASTFLPDRGYPGLYPADHDPEDDRDVVDAGAGDDSISTGDDRDTILAGEGDDTVEAGFDDDEVLGEQGDDRIVAGEGSDTVLGGAGRDTIFGGTGNPDDPINIPDDGSGPFGADLVPDNGRDLLDGGAGDDVIFGEDDDDTLVGGDGDDYLDAGIDDDVVEGGRGDDTIIGGQGTDTLLGGADADTFVITSAGNDTGDQILGGSDGNDQDRFDLSAIGQRGVDWELDDTSTDSDGNGLDGDLVFLDGSGGETGRLHFRNIEIICFTPGTQVATPHGPCAVELLTAGDKVLTRDNGVQEIAWYGQTGLNAADFRARPHLTPVLIRAGALGGGLPERDMRVSPQHRVLISSEAAAYYFDDREVLVAARHLVNGTTIVQEPVPQTTYIHFMCERHEVVLSDGAWTESFQPGDYSLQGIDAAQRGEILSLFPELATETGLKAYTAARRALKRHEARLIAL